MFYNSVLYDIIYAIYRTELNIFKWQDYNRSVIKLAQVTYNLRRRIMCIIQRIIKNVPRYEFSLLYCNACKFVHKEQSKGMYLIESMCVGTSNRRNIIFDKTKCLLYFHKNNPFVQVQYV